MAAMSAFARGLVVGLSVILTPAALARAVVQDNFKFTESNYGIPGRQFALAFAHDTGGDFALLGSVDDNFQQVSVQFSTPEQWKTFQGIWLDARAALVRAAKQGSTEGIQPWVYNDSSGNRMSILLIDQNPHPSRFSSIRRTD